MKNKGKNGTSQEKGLKVHKEQVAPNITRKMTRVVAEQLIREGHDGAEVEQKEEPSAEPASPKPKERKKRKEKPAREYVAVSLEETKSEEEIRQAPKKKGVFSRVVRGKPSGNKKEDQKKEVEKEQPKKTPKITIVHKRKPKGDEKSKLETKRRNGKQKRLDGQEIIDQTINDGNLKNISIFYD
ncbi:FK506-binding protein 4-like [Cryptomeria japonica]|uniref:FK506-binding protein 4-like n=1 Tax=Cryptomeria japonica TaxID=3369 RepID=UPI0027DAAF8C|nr:FK506-binding protein 4-like [Cryptomeria japonica]